MTSLQPAPRAPIAIGANNAGAASLQQRTIAIPCRCAPVPDSQPMTRLGEAPA